MTLNEFKQEIITWKFSKQKTINFAVGLSALLIYEFVARPYYRPYIYSHTIYDFHIADTIGNSLGTIAVVFGFLFLLGGEKSRDQFLIRTMVISVVVYEIAHPLLGKPIDLWDIAATILTGGFCIILHKFLYRETTNTKNNESN
jgi:hypothetical protein